MQLKYRCRNMRSYRAAEHIMENLSLVRTADNQKDFFSLHNGSDTHGISLLRNIINGSKETLIGLDGALGQVHTVSGLGKFFVRLIKADMAVMPQAQKLQVNAAQALNHVLVAGALLIAVRLGAVGNIGAVHVDVNVLKEIVIHEVVVALVIIPGKPSVFIQVHALYTGEIQITFVVPFDQLLVSADWGGSGCQAKDTVRLHQYLGSDDAGCLAA